MNTSQTAKSSRGLRPTRHAIHVHGRTDVRAYVKVNTPAGHLAGVEAAIAAAIASGTRAIHFSPGEYTFDLSALGPGIGGERLIEIPTDFRVYGSGRAARLLMTGLDGEGSGGNNDDGRNLFGVVDGAQNVLFEGLYIIGENGQGENGFTFVNQNQSSAITFLPTTTTARCEVRNCIFENLFGFSIHSAAHVRWTNIINNECNWCANGVNVNGHRTIQARNRLYKSEGFECTGESNLFCQNIIKDCYLAGFSIGGDQEVGKVQRGNIVANNIIDGVTNPGGQGRAIFLGNSNVGAIVSGNTIQRTTGFGIAIATDLGGAVNGWHEIVGNQLQAIGDGNLPEAIGILVSGSGYNHIHGNTLLNASNEPAFYMLLGISVGSNGNVIEGNVLGGTNYGLTFSDGLAENLVRNNTYVQSQHKVFWGNGLFPGTVHTAGSRSRSAAKCLNMIGQESHAVFYETNDGAHHWGAGGVDDTDVSLYRSEAGVLKTNGIFEAAAIRDLSLVNGISVKAFGAVGDGTTDDTEAILAALERANGIARGTWEAGDGDQPGNPAPRARKVTVFPPGVYRVTRTIPIKYKSVVMAGQPGGIYGGVYEGRFSRIVCDHGATGIQLNADFNVDGFSMYNLQIVRSDHYARQGVGIKLEGSGFLYGMLLDGVQVQGFAHGANLVCNNNEAGATGMLSALVVRNCLFVNNDIGFRVRGHATISLFENNQIAQNKTAGLLLGAIGTAVRGNILEGQPRPLEVGHGSASRDVIVEGNYFESTVDPETTQASALFGLCSRFTARRNTFGNNPERVPMYAASTCQEGSFDRPAVVHGCVDVIAAEYIVDSEVLEGNATSVGCNLSVAPFPAVSSVATPTVVSDPTGTAVVNRERFNVREVMNDYRTLLNGLGALGHAETITIVVSVRYTGDLPYGTPTFQLIGTVDGTSKELYTWGVVRPDSVRVGDIVQYLLRWKSDKNEATSCGLYIYPWGPLTTTRNNGAEVFDALLWKNTDEGMRFFNSLAVIPLASQ